jgi:hypothetical protein
MSWEFEGEDTTVAERDFGRRQQNVKKQDARRRNGFAGAKQGHVLRLAVLRLRLYPP